MIRVIVAEDQSMILGALAALLEIDGDIEVIGRPRDGRDALDMVITQQPDVLVTDIEMPHMSGLEVAAEVGRRVIRTRVVILTTFAPAGYLRRALDAGASGYLLKDSPADELANAIRLVHAGGRAVDPALAQEAWTEKDPLSDRERQVLRLASEGLPGTAIAAGTNLSEGTCATICRTPSLSWAPPTASRRRESRGPRVGCRHLVRCTATVALNAQAHGQ